MGGGKDGNGGAQTPRIVGQLAEQQAGAARDIAGAISPVQRQGARQITDILRTGGVGANIPSIEAAVRAQQGATQRAGAQVGEALNRAGVGEVLGGRLRANIGQAGDVGAQGIRAAMVSPVFQQALAQIFGGGGLAPAAAAGGLGTQAAGTRLVGPNVIGAQRAGAGIADVLNQPQTLQLIRGLFGG